MCAWRSHQRSHSPACAPSCAGASAALGRPRPGGKRCVPRLWRASGLRADRQARAAFTMPSL
eukprot:12773722-Alexandrium_andersonii.AAC.1